MLKLLKNCDVYAPKHLGMRDILLAGDKIMKVTEKIEGYEGLDGVEVMDLHGAIVTPGLIDIHVHVTGGGGEQGYHSRTPELNLSELIRSGVTTVLGLLGTDGTTPGITQGANTTEAQYVAKQLAGETGRRQFITKEQVEYAARELFGEEVELTHQSVPVGADPREQYRYYEEYGVYAYPEKQPIWYLPVLLDLWDVSFNTKEAQIVFVRYADSEQNSFWGPGTEPIARWDIEEHANYNIDQYQSYTVTLKEMFGEWDIEEILPSQS